MARDKMKYLTLGSIYSLLIIYGRVHECPGQCDRERERERIIVERQGNKPRRRITLAIRIAWCSNFQ